MTVSWTENPCVGSSILPLATSIKAGPRRFHDLRGLCFFVTSVWLLQGTVGASLLPSGLLATETTGDYPHSGDVISRGSLYCSMVRVEFPHNIGNGLLSAAACKIVPPAILESCRRTTNPK